MPLCAAPLRSTRPPLLKSLLRANGAPDAASSLRCRARGFHSSPSRRGDVAHKNHYERLGVRHDASTREIKKSFYSLSKTHHPDVNPSTTASATFSLLSESYRVLSDPSRRAAYDRDVLRLHHHPPSHARGASYHSTNPAGGRAPSGLSRRRGAFRGPPPSFYQSGGWGAHAEKRRAAHEESTGAADAAAHGTTQTHHHAHPHHAHQHSAAHQHSHADPWATAYSHHHGGMGPGSDPFHHAASSPHFDQHGHTRTQGREDQRRTQRVRQANSGIEIEARDSTAGHFLIITGILVATLLAPLVYTQFMRLGKTKKDRNS